MFEGFRCARFAANAAGSCSTASLAALTPTGEQLLQPANKRTRRQHAAGSPDDAPPTPPPAAAVAPKTDPVGSPVLPTSQQEEASSGGLPMELMGDQPLRLVIVGHNPSEHAWRSGHFYSNPSNWLWRILRETGIAPPDQVSGAVDDRKMPVLAGVGFTDVGSGTPGTDSAKFSSQHFAAWRPHFFARMSQQAQRASAAIGCTCGRCGAPAFVAFSGKRQFAELFAVNSSRGGGGRGRGKRRHPSSIQAPAELTVSEAAAGLSAGQSQPVQALQPGTRPQQQQPGALQQPGELQQPQLQTTLNLQQQQQQPHLPTLRVEKPDRIDSGRQWVLPEGWPLPLETEVWVMTSTSGAAPMTRQQRYAPWQALAERLRREPWPRRCALRCQAAS